jgi:hypothetical protein
MRTKRLTAILLAVFFMCAIILSCAFIFSIQKIDVKFAADNTIETCDIQNDLDQFNKRNIVFFELEEIENVVAKYPYFKLEKLYKSYPNVIKIELSQRIPVYNYIFNDNVFLIDKTGFVVEELTVADFQSKNLLTIDLTYASLDGLTLSVGNQVQAKDQELFKAVLSMCESIDLTDCVNAVNVNDHAEFRDVLFCTNSGVNIEITSATVRGEEKINVAMQSYHNAKDYYKTFDTITVFVLESDGSIQCEWTSWKKGE